MKHIKTLYDWRDIKGYENKYQVNQFGHVRNVITNKRLYGSPDPRQGYLRVDLRKNGVRKTYRIHRLVAEAFIPNSDNYDTVDHIDFNRTNNNVLNLRWMSLEENSSRRKGKF